MLTHCTKLICGLKNYASDGFVSFLNFYFICMFKLYSYDYFLDFIALISLLFNYITISLNWNLQWVNDQEQCTIFFTKKRKPDPEASDTVSVAYFLVSFSIMQLWNPYDMQIPKVTL